jgi:hypothetical protein
MTIILFWFRFRLRFQFQYQIRNRIQTIISSLNKKEHCFPENQPLVFFNFFYFVIPFSVGSGSQSGSGTGSGVLSSSDFARQKYGSCGSGSFHNNELKTIVYLTYKIINYFNSTVTFSAQTTYLLPQVILYIILNQNPGFRILDERNGSKINTNLYNDSIIYSKTCNAIIAMYNRYFQAIHKESGKYSIMYEYVGYERKKFIHRPTETIILETWEWLRDRV